MSGSLQRGVAVAATVVLLAALGWTILRPAGQYRVTSGTPDLLRRAHQVALDLPAQRHVGVEQPGEHCRFEHHGRQAIGRPREHRTSAAQDPGRGHRGGRGFDPRPDVALVTRLLGPPTGRLLGRRPFQAVRKSKIIISEKSVIPFTSDSTWRYATT